MGPTSTTSIAGGFGNIIFSSSGWDGRQFVWCLWRSQGYWLQFFAMKCFGQLPPTAFAISRIFGKLVPFFLSLSFLLRMRLKAELHLGVDHKSAAAAISIATCRHPTRGTLSGIAGNHSCFFCVLLILRPHFMQTCMEPTPSFFVLHQAGCSTDARQKKVTPYKFYP